MAKHATKDEPVAVSVSAVDSATGERRVFDIDVLGEIRKVFADPQINDRTVIGSIVFLDDPYTKELLEAYFKKLKMSTLDFKIMEHESLLTPAIEAELVLHEPLQSIIATKCYKEFAAELVAKDEAAALLEQNKTKTAPADNVVDENKEKIMNEEHIATEPSGWEESPLLNLALGALSGALKTAFNADVKLSGKTFKDAIAA